MLSAPHSLRAEKDGFIKIAATRDYVDVPGTAFVTHADKIKKQPNMIKRFMRAGLRAMNYIRDNRTDTTQMIMREFGMDQDIAALAYKVLARTAQPRWQKSRRRLSTARRLRPRRAKDRPPDQCRAVYRRIDFGRDNQGRVDWTVALRES